MKIGKVTYLVLLVLSAALRSHAQQQTHYTQYMFSGLVINPAYTGVDEALSATFIDRHQWVGVEGAPVTQTLTLHGLNKRKKVGLGLVVSNDKIGVHKNLYVRGSYAYHIKVAQKSFLSLGLQAGIAHLRSDYGSLVGASNPDPKLNNARINELFFDMGAGVYFRSPRFQGGISVPEFISKSSDLNDSVTVNLKNANLFGFLKYRLPLSPAWEMEPAVLLKHFTRVPVSIDLSLMLIYKEILKAGASYRKDESLAYLLTVRATPQLYLGYAYDSPFRTGSGMSARSHELMIQYLFRFERSGLKSPRI